MAFKRMLLGQKKKNPPRRTAGNKFEVWQNDKGEWCLGNECFSMKAAGDSIQVKMNPDGGKKCPANMQQAVNTLMDIVREEKPVKFSVPPEGYNEW